MVLGNIGDAGEHVYLDFVPTYLHSRTFWDVGEHMYPHFVPAGAPGSHVLLMFHNVLECRYDHVQNAGTLVPVLAA